MTDTGSRSSLRGDIFGGITAGIVALPLALAFGVQSGLGAEYGLYGAIFIGFFASIFGGTAVQISGPTGPMTVVTTGACAAMVAATGSLEEALPALVVMFVLAGLMQIAMGLLRIGSLIKFIPYPVVSGFMSGIGVIIILLDIFPALGLASPKSTVAVVTSLGDAVAGANLAALATTIATITIIYLFPKVTKAVPSPLVALLVITFVAATLGLEVPVIGDIPSGFPELQLGGLLDIPVAQYGTIVATAVTLAALGAIDSLLTSVVADNLTKTRHNSNRELIGQGIGNAVAGVFGGLPGAGATMRTVVNVQAGGSTRLSGAVHGLLLLAVLLGVGTYAAYIPMAVLAGILITVGIGILDYNGILHLNKVPRSDALIMVVVLLVTVFSSLLVAVAIGMVIACILFMKRMSEIVEDGIEVGTIQTYQDDHRWPDEEMPAELEGNVLVTRLTGPVFFGFAKGLQESFAKLPKTRYLILRMKRVPFVDQSGLYALDDAICQLAASGVTVLLSGLQSQPSALMRRIGTIPERVPENHVFANFRQSVGFLVSDFRASTTRA